MDNCWILCQVMADMKKVYDDLIIISLYLLLFQEQNTTGGPCVMTISLLKSDSPKPIVSIQ